MSDNSNSPPPTPASSHPRRSSIAGQTFADLFGSQRSPSSTYGPNNPGPITTAAAQAQRRRLSLSTAGLSGSPTQNAPLGRARTESASSGSGSLDESAVEEGDAAGTPATSNPTTPFVRRMSFGAQALRDARMRNASGGGQGGGGNSNGEGFTWSENLRSRAERSSIGSASMMGSLTSSTTTRDAGRAKSTTVQDAPIREMPSQAKAPDHYQERILKGDFYMD